MTITTLNSQLNSLLEQQASIICNAEAFAKDLENVSMKELKKIAAEWNVIPDNKTKKASYIAALHIRYEEKNGLAEVNEQIKKITFQIKCAEAQECANAQQKVIRVIRTIDQTWWVGTEETFHTIYPNEGYEIHFTARPELPAQIEQEPPQELVAWLDEIREYAQNGGIIVSPTHKPYSITGYRIDGTGKQWRCMDAYQAERDAQTLWETGRWARLEINGEVRYPVPQEPTSLTSNPAILMQDVKIAGTMYTVYGCDKEELAQETIVLTEAVHRDHPLQGVTSFFSSLAVFSAHDILPLNIVGDIELYEQLKSQWDDMGGDEKCQCDWCDAEPLHYQEQEELQHTEHLQEQLPTVEIRKGQGPHS